MTPWTYIVGWTLVHFVWQGAALAILAAVALRLCRHRTADARYAVACAVLASMLASPVVTARLLMTPDETISLAGRPFQITAASGAIATGSRNLADHGPLSIEAVRTGVDAVLPLIVFAWLAGVTVLLVRMAGGLSHVRRLQRRTIASEPSRWRAAAERIGARMGLRQGVHVVESDLVDAPVALGWLRPVIILPVAALANLTPSQVEAILAHELVHIRRYDYLVNVVQTMTETLLFFHPGVWWVSGRIRVEREHCCDDVAVRVCGDPVDYAAALAELEAWRSGGTTLAMAAVGGSLIERVRRVLKLPPAHESRSLGWGVTLGLTVVSVVVAGGIYVSSFGPSPQAPAQNAEQQVEPIASPESFGWQIHRTSRFDIHYYPALGPNLEQAASAAERAYERVRSELQYDLSFRVPLVLFKTRSDFAQQEIIRDVGGVGAIARGEIESFSEPRRNRVVMLFEEDPDRLYRLITHELTHVFAFDVIPRSPGNNSRVPAWIDEGLAEYMTATWDPAHLNQVRDLVVTDKVPALSELVGGIDAQSWPITVHLGHAAFEFIEAEHGKAAIWPFLLEVRRSVVDGAGNPYQAAFNRTPGEFDAAFADYLRKRFGA
jgi:beta-lactamase regulating signal transducer with metallopeptidase domain